MAHWKVVWQTISGIKHLTKENFIKFLQSYSQCFIDGICQFPPYNENSYKEWAKSNLTTTNSTTSAFLLRLCKVLNLDGESGWNILCNYFMYEYHGSLDEIQKIAQYEIQIIPLLQSIWQFYTFERMFIIKSFKYILEHYTDQMHPNYEEFQNFVNNLNIKDVRKSLHKQLKFLIHEINENNSEHCFLTKLWVHRNYTETIEIIHLLMFTLNTTFTSQQFKELFDTFKEHAFGTQPMFFVGLQYTDKQLLEKIKYSESALFLCIMNQFWEGKENWLSIADEVEKGIIDISGYGDHCIVLLSWIILNMTLSNDTSREKFKSFYYKHTYRAIQQGVFKQIHALLNLTMFKDTIIGKMLREAVYNLTNHLATKFDKCATSFLHHGITDYICTLLKDSSLATKSISNCESSTGIKMIINQVMEMFPADFFSFTNIMESLCSHKSLIKEVVNGITRLKSFTEQQEDYRQHSYQDVEEVVVIHDGYSPYNNDLVVFPPRSRANIFNRYEKQFVCYYGDVNFFNIAFHYIKDLQKKLFILCPESELDTKYVHAILKLFRIIIDTDYTLLQNESLQKLDNTIYSLLSVCMERSFYNVDVISEILKIYTIHCRFKPEETVKAMNIVKLLPNLGDMQITMQNIHKDEFLSYGALLQTELITKRKEQITHEILLNYLEFLINYWSLSNSEDKSKIEMPGFIVLLKDVFPVYLNWTFADENMSYQISKYLLRLFISILKKTPEDDENKYMKTMFIFTLTFFHENENNILALMRICNVGNTVLQVKMQNETNWNKGPTCEAISVTQLGLTLLMQLLNLRRFYTSSKDKTPLEKHVYIKDSKDFKIVRTIAGYLSFPYNSIIPLLATRLLKKITEKLEMSLVATLHMEQEQIRQMLLERLRDPSESTDMKVALLELITVCIDKQHGMTTAFFDIDNMEQKKKKGVAENIVDYMAEYIRNTAKSTTYLYSPLFIAILDLFHMLWESDKEILLQDLVNESHFWSAFTSPLFQELVLDNKSYAQLLHIITMEVYKTHKQINPDLMKVIQKFFNDKGNTISVWMTHVSQSVKYKNQEANTFDQAPNWLLLLRTWKELNIVIGTTLHSESMEVISDELKQKLVKLVRNSLLDHLKRADDSRIVLLWTELYVGYQTAWENKSFFSQEQVLLDLIDILEQTEDIYHKLPKHCQESFLTMIYRSVICLKDCMLSKPNITLNFLIEFTPIFHFECDSFDKDKYPTYDETMQLKRHPHTTLILCLSVVNTILESKCSQELRDWFVQNQYIEKMFNFIIILAEDSNHYMISETALEGLNVYASSDIARDFTLLDMKSRYWPDIRSKPEFQLIGKSSFTKKNMWEIRHWWVIYTKIISLHLTLLNKYGNLLLNDLLSFLNIHETIIIETLQLIKCTVDINALNLIITILLFIKALLKYRERWYHTYGQMFNNIMEKGVQFLLNGSIGILLRPKILENFGKHKTLEQIPVDLMDKLIDTITLSAFCFLEYSPKLMDLIKYSGDVPRYPMLLISDFRVPKVNMDAECQVSYGSLLCTAHLYIKALQQICVKKRATGNRREILTARKRTESLQSSEIEKQTLAQQQPTSSSSIETSKEYKRLRKLPSTANQGTPEYPNAAVASILSNINAYKLNSIQTFATSATSGMCAPWLPRLNEQKVYRSLEVIMTLVAEQAVLTLNDSEMDKKDLQFIRRELFSELQIFHDFVKNLYRNSSAEKLILLRKKYGTTSYIPASKHNFKHIIGTREMACRKLIRSIANPSLYLEEISSINEPMGDSICVQSQDDDIFLETDKEIEYVGLNEVIIVEEDYVLMLSNWFINQCQLHH